MENSFVTLELKTYNEMYDKAKKFDEKFNKMKSLNEDDNKSDYKIGDEVLIKGIISTIDPDDRELPYEIETEYGSYCWVNKNEIYKEEEK